VLREQLAETSGDCAGRRGLGTGNPIDQGKLRDTYVNLLLERGATTEASTMRWQLFDQHPTQIHDNDLRRTAERTGDWPGLRDKAIRRLRDATTSSACSSTRTNSTMRGRRQSTMPTAYLSTLESAHRPTSTHPPPDVIELWQQLIQRRRLFDGRRKQGLGSI